jgi:hypothetical protein
MTLEASPGSGLFIYDVLCITSKTRPRTVFPSSRVQACRPLCKARQVQFGRLSRQLCVQGLHHSAMLRKTRSTGPKGGIGVLMRLTGFGGLEDLAERHIVCAGQCLVREG